MRPSAPGSLAWQRLQELADAGVGRDLPALFNSDRERESRYTRSAAGLRFDFSRQRITDDVFNELTALSAVIELPTRIAEMWRGDRINTTEDRAVLHVALRQDAGDAIGGAAIEAEVVAERERLLKFADSVRESAAFDHVINIGIGGSDLGPKFVVSALASGVRRTTPEIHFVSSVDGCSLVALLEWVDPRRTLFIVCSKTFTTQETMSNATLARDWLVSKLGEAAVAQHFVAVSVNEPAMDRFGIAPDRRFKMWDWVGGRFSVWSSVGLAGALALGSKGFRRLLSGARELDRHFVEAAAPSNLPFLMGALGVWNIHFQKLASLAVLPYSESLALLPSFLQQLEMESNGKSVTREGDSLGWPTAPVIWGGGGNDGQHSYYQALHQGTVSAALDFVLVKESPCGKQALQQLANANAAAQIEAFAMGNASDDPQRRHAGSRPCSVLLMNAVTPETIGALIALYEHKVFVQSLIWGVNAFDQFGVELGKRLCAGFASGDLQPISTRLLSKVLG